MCGSFCKTKSDLFDAHHLPQVRVYHKHAVRADLRVTISQQLGVNVMSRFQHRANGRYLRRLIGDELNEHFKTSWKTEVVASHAQSKTSNKLFL